VLNNLKEAKMKKSRAVIMVAALMFIGANIASAGTIGLSTLIGEEGSIQIGDKIFADFSFSSNTGEVTAAGINVEAIQSGFDYYLIFTGDMVAGYIPGVATDFVIGYTVATTSGDPLLVGIDQWFQLSSGGTGGDITIAESAYASNPFVPGIPPPVVAQSNVSFIFPNSDYEDPPGEPLQGDQLVINPPLAKIWIKKDFNLDPNEGGTVGTSILIQSFHQVPEPTTLLLLGLGLSGLAIWKRRAK
jgi:hypothetical protein